MQKALVCCLFSQGQGVWTRKRENNGGEVVSVSQEYLTFQFLPTINIYFQIPFESHQQKLAIQKCKCSTLFLIIPKRSNTTGMIRFNVNNLIHKYITINKTKNPVSTSFYQKLKVFTQYTPFNTLELSNFKSFPLFSWLRFSQECLLSSLL